jgi:hypothetical protein
MVLEKNLYGYSTPGKHRDFIGDIAIGLCLGLEETGSQKSCIGGSNISLGAAFGALNV